jgi:hypothetical protein
MAVQVRFLCPDRNETDAQDRKFDAKKERFGSQLSAKLLNEISMGWVATYEIWSIQGGLRRLCRAILLRLENAELLTQMRRTLTQGFWNSSWKLQFPTTISANLRTFCVLRTIYILHDYKSNSGPKTTSLVLPLDFRQGMVRGLPRPGAYALRQRTPMGRSQKQEYFVKICPLSRYICFRDFAWVAVYELSEVEEHPRLSVLSQIPDLIVQDVFCLHGNLPLLAFAEPSSIQLWDFKGKGMSSLFANGNQ